MRSSSGAYLSNLDHLRAFAAFQVFIWHFVHQAAECDALCFAQDYPVGSILEEGHTGVSLFMCISGYVFAKLTDGKEVNVILFWYNRAMRLLPLLAAWSFITVVSNILLGTITSGDLKWVLTPNWLASMVLAPGGWSILIELQFYALFPFLLGLAHRAGNRWLVAIALGMVAVRGVYWLTTGSVQYEAYWTLAGRMDQLLIGYCSYHFALRFSRRSLLAIGAAALGILLVAYDAFNRAGGFYGTSDSPLWIFLPMLEALCYSGLIAGYVQLKLPGALDSALARVGTWSYSVYLGHFFFVYPLFFIIATGPGMPQSFWGRFAWALIAFPVVVAVSAMTYRTIEAPFLAYRKNYLMPRARPVGNG